MPMAAEAQAIAKDSAKDLARQGTQYGTSQI